MKLTEARHNYAKRALKILFNGSQKTFQVQKNTNICTYEIPFDILLLNKCIFFNCQVLLNDCITNVHLGDEGVIDKLISLARSMVISNNAQYTRVSTRTCQLIIAIASNSEAVYPYHLISVNNIIVL